MASEDPNDALPPGEADAAAMFAEQFRAPAEERMGLRAGLGSEDFQALAAYSLHVCESGSKEEIRYALELLDLIPIPADRTGVREHAVRVLPGLCRLDQDTDILAAALPIYGRYMPDPPAVRTLRAMVGHPLPQVRAGAVEGLEYFADEGSSPSATLELVEWLVRALIEDPDAQVRRTAVRAFIGLEGWWGYEPGRFPELIPLVVTALGRAVRDDPDQRVRGEAAERLACLSDLEERHWPLVDAALRPYTEDGNVRVAGHSLARLASLGDPGALERLWTTLAAPDVHRLYLSAAKRALTSCPHPSAESLRRLREALRRLRELGWRDDASGDVPRLSPEEHAYYLDLLLDGLPG
ncbi:HEAT repeat-containing protein [Thermomonospora echinospora]|uniref:HEAT repeat-containing protein n=1 Tax=Thermomonospora echinospora TaxID=1992 RepID=A0A1H5YVD6_9ACTN|nr:HEAT repeat domain-containing protein [Thermomonospora echinospora]SEG27954.1 HEAT repeat-containing protein [Thermomonospora echinospora]